MATSDKDKHGPRFKRTMSDDDEVQRMAAATYRRQACLLLAGMTPSSGENQALVKSMEQSLGQTCLLQKDVLASKPSKPSELDMRVPASFLHCLTCGAWLQPGLNGTTVRLRSLGRGRTRRRRASRRKAKLLLAKKQASVAGGRQWKREQVESGNDTLKKERELSCVTDGTCRNAIVYTCGSCGAKRKLKGLEAKKQTTKSENPMKQPPVRVYDKKQTDGKPPALAVNSNTDFIPVAGSKHKPKRLEPPKKKKGKKKKTPDKGSKLLDFLSSLNDS